MSFPMCLRPIDRLFEILKKVGELPLAYWGNLKENYEACNKDYKGVSV